ncbi:MAG: hypothetical protein J0L57_13825 [Burkholderiales bacterium]|nr:hypothetical protein [Burkholderiales bacterium]
MRCADQVLRGAPVGGLPFEQPTRITPTLDRSTAGAIGLTCWQSLPARAAELIG